MPNALDDLSIKLNKLVTNYNTLNDLPPWVRDLTADVLKRNITIETWNNYVRILQYNSSNVKSIADFLEYLGDFINNSLRDTITVNNVVVNGSFYIGGTSGPDLIRLINSIPIVEASPLEGHLIIDGVDTVITPKITSLELDDICQ